MPRKAANSRFSAALTEVIDESFAGNGAELARATGLTPSLIGYYTRPGPTGRFPSQAQIERLISPLPEDQQRRLLAAYLMDHIPDGYAGLVKVSGVKNAPAPRRPLPRDVEAVLDQLRDAAAKDNTVKAWLLATGRILHP